MPKSVLARIIWLCAAKPMTFFALSKRKWCAWKMGRAIALTMPLQALLAMQGCATVSSSWPPFPDKSEIASFESRVKAKRLPPDMVTLKSELSAYWNELYLAALTRSQLEWESAGMASYGGLASVAGGLASKIALVNTGAAIASFGLINSGFYRFPQQTQIYLTALKRDSCILGKVNVVDDGLLRDAAQSSDPVASGMATNFIQTAITAVDSVRVDYTSALLGLAPSVPSREEILAAYGRFRTGGAAAAHAAGAPVANPAYDQAGEIVRALSAEIQACAKL